jgi:hypothetical protein
MKMRKILFVAFGLASLGFNQSALAEDACTQTYRGCIRGAMDKAVQGIEADPTGTSTKACTALYVYCTGIGRSGVPGPTQKQGDGGNAEGGGSKPKQVNGQSQRTADGGTIMVTREGKEWVWNGKYNYNIVTINRAGYTVTITVMQGDPAVTEKRYVDGRLYSVADPAYPAAIAAEQKKAAAAVAAAAAELQAKAKKIVQKTSGPVSTPTTPPSPPSKPAVGAGLAAGPGAAKLRAQ